MSERGILEVQTPVFSQRAVTDPNIHSFKTDFSSPKNTDDCCLYLNTSPEFGMKRLLAAGTGPIYQIAQVFRNEEESPLHEPEFSLLEWYRPGFDLQQVMDEVEELALQILDCPPIPRIA